MKVSKKYWDERYQAGGDSGYGSRGAQLIKKLQWLDTLDISSIYDYGCGDFNFGKHLLELYPNASYTGYDPSKVIVEQNKINYPMFWFSSAKSKPDADLVLCIDVLFHILDEEELEKTLKNLESYTNYLAVTAYERDEEMEGHVRIRTFDYKRFGEPLIRQVVEEDGQLYFYLFKRPAIDITKTTCVLITKEKTYPPEVIENIKHYPFGEVLIGLYCDSPYRKYELIEKAKFDTIYYQDDDAIVPIDKLLAKSKPGIITVGMKAGHFEAHKNSRATMGLGWGSFFPKKLIKTLSAYTDVYGKDEVFKRETERILTYLNYPQNRVVLDIVDLPSAYAADRLWRQPMHNTYKELAEKRCSLLSPVLLTPEVEKDTKRIDGKNGKRHESNYYCPDAKGH